MSLRKFGTGDGRVTEVEDTGSEGFSKEAAQSRPWSPRDEQELEQETLEDGHGGEIPSAT